VYIIASGQSGRSRKLTLIRQIVGWQVSLIAGDGANLAIPRWAAGSRAPIMKDITPPMPAKRVLAALDQPRHALLRCTQPGD
jgi:hypothetical protein